MKVGISHNIFTLENLGEKDLTSIKIRLRSLLHYSKEFSAEINILSSKQIISKNLAEFTDKNGKNFFSMNSSRFKFILCDIISDPKNHIIILFSR